MTMVTMLIFRRSFHDVQAQFQFLVMRCFTFNKPSTTISYPIWRTQLVSTVTKSKKQKKTKENTITKRIRLTKTKLKGMLKYEQVKETIKKVSKMKEKSPNL